MTKKLEAIFSNLPTLETERLILRRLRIEDAKDIFEYACDPLVTQFTTWHEHQSLADSQLFLESVIEEYKTNQAATWGIVHKGDNKLIGTCGFFHWNVDDSKAEVGYNLSRKYWNQGYMTEAVRAIITFGFETMLLNRIEALCQPENIASARVMEKVGMQFEGILRQEIFVKGTFQDSKIYSLLREEWLTY